MLVRIWHETSRLLQNDNLFTDDAYNEHGLPVDVKSRHLDVYLKTAYANGRWEPQTPLALQPMYCTPSRSAFDDVHILGSRHKSRFFKHYQQRARSGADLGPKEKYRNYRLYRL
jgi:hypothetical protein